MFQGCLSLIELESFLVATRISGQDNSSVIKPTLLLDQTTKSGLGQAIYFRPREEQTCLLERR